MKFFIFRGPRKYCALPMALSLCLVLLSVKVWSAEAPSGNLLQNTGFEVWENKLPSHWFGSASSIPEANVHQSSEAYSGNSSCRLVRTQKTHVRFSSAPLALKSGIYQFSYYVKGSGCIRNSFYNGTSYAAYSDYDTLSNVKDWKKKVYEFELKKDAEVQLLFSICTTDTLGLFIDDVYFADVATALNQAQAAKLQIRTADGMLTLELAQPDRLLLYDLHGRTVYDHWEQGTVNISLPRGIYLLKTCNQSQIFKLSIP